MAPKSLGEPIKFDPTFKGPLYKRSCTDILCLIIFLIFVGCWIAIGIYVMKVGDLSTILTPRDSDGRKCGIDSGLENKKYLLFFDLMKCAGPTVPITGCKTTQVCVEKCPTDTFIFKVDRTRLSLNEMRSKIVCKPEINKQITTDFTKLVEKDVCSAWYLPSISVYKRCVPLPNIDQSTIDLITNNSTSFWQSISNIKALNEISEIGHMIVEDVVASGWYIAYGLIISMIICLAYIFLMRWMAGFMIWLSIIGLIVLLIYAIYFSSMKYKSLKDFTPPTDVDPNSLEGLFALKNTWLTIIILASIFLFVIVVITFALRSKICLAIALIEEGSKAVASITSSLFFPIVPWILQALIIGFAVTTALYISSIGTAEYAIKGDIKDPDSNCICIDNSKYYKGAVCSPNIFEQDCHQQGSLSPCTKVYCHYMGLNNPKTTNIFHAVNGIGLIWCLFFVSAMGEMILAATFATWYWTFNKSKVPYFTVTKSTYRTIRYHLGTLAFGSLIITICRIIRIIIEYIDHKLKKYDNAFTRAVMCMFKCCFWCLEKFLKFMNRNAYIVCAIHGKNFCASAKEAFFLLMRNVLRVFVLDKVTSFLFFVGKLFITIILGILSYYVFAYHSKDIKVPDLHYNLVPVIIICIGTFFISSVFFAVYTMAVDTLFMCFLEDCERNDGSAEKPYYMSKDLMKILGKRNKTS